MQTTLKLAKIATPRLTPSSRGYATLVATKLKHKAAKDLANDGTGNHTHVAKQTCVLKDCDSKKCSVLCDQPDEMTLRGHKPPVGCIAKYISSHDAHGNSKPQYYVKTNCKQCSITEQEKIQYGKDIKLDPIQQTFIDTHKDKYE